MDHNFDKIFTSFIIGVLVGLTLVYAWEMGGVAKSKYQNLEEKIIIIDFN